MQPPASHSLKDGHPLSHFGSEAIQTIGQLHMVDLLYTVFDSYKELIWQKMLLEQPNSKTLWLYFSHLQMEGSKWGTYSDCCSSLNGGLSGGSITPVLPLITLQFGSACLNHGWPVTVLAEGSAPVMAAQSDQAAQSAHKYAIVWAMQGGATGTWPHPDLVSGEATWLIKHWIIQWTCEPGAPGPCLHIRFLTLNLSAVQLPISVHRQGHFPWLEKIDCGIKI